MSDREPLLIEREGGVLTLSVNDPPINRMSFENMDALEASAGARTELLEIHADREVSVAHRGDQPEVHPLDWLESAAHELAEQLAAMPSVAVAGVLTGE